MPESLATLRLSVSAVCLEPGMKTNIYQIHSRRHCFSFFGSGTWLKMISFAGLGPSGLALRNGLRHGASMLKRGVKTGVPKNGAGGEAKESALRSKEEIAEWVKNHDKGVSRSSRPHGWPRPGGGRFRRSCDFLDRRKEQNQNIYWHAHPRSL